MTGPSPADMLEIQSGAHLANILPEIQADMDKMGKQLMNKAFALIDKGELSHQQAYDLWLELYAQHRLLKKLEQRVKLATSTATRHSRHMEI